MEVFETLIFLREERKLTQQAVADILKIKRTTYASYETGRVNMSAKLLQKLAKHYLISVDSILSGSASLSGQKETNVTKKEFTELQAQVAKLKSEVLGNKEEAKPEPNKLKRAK